MADAEFEGLDARALRQKLDELHRANTAIAKENALYESYKLRRLKPSEIEQIEAELAAAKGKKKKVATKGGPKGAAELGVEQKLEIATAEAEAAKKDTKQMLDDAQRTFDMLAALLEQAELRTVELKKEAHEFRRDVVLAGENPRTGTVMSEKVVSYYEDNLRHKDNVIDKLRLKVAGLKQQEESMKKQLASKEEVGDVLHYIDFHQLQIENNQATSALEDKNTELMRLKLTTGATVGTLNALKARLSTLVKQASQLKADISARRALSIKLREENTTMSATVARAQTLHDTLVVQARSARDMPQPLDYVELTRTQAVLNRELASWSRKLEIAVMAESRSLSKLRSAVTSGTVGEDTLRELEGYGTSTSAAGIAGRTGALRATVGSSAGGDAGGQYSYTSAGVTRAMVAGLPGHTRPVGHGSTTVIDGRTGLRTLGSVTGATKWEERTDVHEKQRGKPAPLPAGIAGFAGSLARHTVATRVPAGPAAGTLQLGRPMTLEEQERRKAKALAASILGSSAASPKPFKLGRAP